MTEDDQQDSNANIVSFPFSRVRMKSDATIVDLGLTPLSKQVDSPGRNPKGHWCGRCRGIWYSYFLEAECPVCGNRHG